MKSELHLKEWNNGIPYDVLDDIYHSTSADEMQVKADMHCIKLDDPDVILYLIRTTTYHHAFWPHTSKRFTALKNLLRKSRSLPQSKDFSRLKKAVKDRITEVKNNKWSIYTPGGKQQVKNLIQVLDIFKKLEKDYEQKKTV